MKRFMKWVNQNDTRIGCYVISCIALLVVGAIAVFIFDDESQAFGLFMLFAPGVSGLTAIALYDPPKSE